MAGSGRTGGVSALTTWHRPVLAAIGRWPWLHRLDAQVADVALPLYDRHRDNVAVELMHGGRWAGHSVHAALSDLPIGLWSGVLVLDMVGLDVVGGDEAADRVGPAAALSAVGIAAAVATAVTGATDWTVSDGEDRRVGLFHGLLNVAATALQAASLAARVTGHRRPAQALGVTSMAVTTAAGYLGGHLVQGRGVMVNRTAASTGPTRWVRALDAADLPDGATAGVVVDGRQVLLHRKGDDVHAIDDLCSHAGALLSRGEVVDCVVTCPLHLSRFDVRDGHIVRGPAHHPQPVLPARIRGDGIEVRGDQPRARRAKN